MGKPISADAIVTPTSTTTSARTLSELQLEKVPLLAGNPKHLDRKDSRLDDDDLFTSENCRRKSMRTVREFDTEDHEEAIYSDSSVFITPL